MPSAAWTSFFSHTCDYQKRCPEKRMTFLLARDDVGDHAKWARHYDIPRIIHEADVNEDTKDCEVRLEGEGPWTMGDDVDVEELEIIFTPGHTPGSLCLFHKPSKSMFTGLTEYLPSARCQSRLVCVEHR